MKSHQGNVFLQNEQIIDIFPFNLSLRMKLLICCEVINMASEIIIVHVFILIVPYDKLQENIILKM